ncbi:DUF5129 domain-containing protein [Corynebacterium heidelbergense]|uniref:DUF5129 domain-containing protein n=1 Tax=Corynebacterium heidelbergense TaxID=2055947 RepID=UPI001401D804|nr:DUF5129 domain-containing protein [Corynebacterium heidelbergense]
MLIAVGGPVLYGATPDLPGGSPASAATTAPGSTATADPASGHFDPARVHVQDEALALGIGGYSDLVDKTAALSFPSSVISVTYVILPPSQDELEAHLLSWAQQSDPSVLAAGTNSSTKWASGALIIAVEPSSRHNGIFCGTDVCSALGLNNSAHLTESLEAMKPGLRDQNYVEGLVGGARAALAPSSDQGSSFLGSDHFFSLVVGLFIVVFVFIGLVWIIIIVQIVKLLTHSGADKTENLRSSVAELRVLTPAVERGLPTATSQLRSLTGPLVDPAYHQSWQDIQARASGATTRVTALGLGDQPSRRDLRRRRREIKELYDAVTVADRAERQIALLSGLETGDPNARLEAIFGFRADVERARVSDYSHPARPHLADVQARLDWLRDHPDDELFLHRLAETLEKYWEALQLVAQRMRSLRLNRHVPPGLGSENWHVGSGAFGGFVTFAVLERWHAKDRSPNSWDSSGSMSSFSSSDSSSSSSSDSGGGSSSY